MFNALGHANSSHFHSPYRVLDFDLKKLNNGDKKFLYAAPGVRTMEIEQKLQTH